MSSADCAALSCAGSARRWVCMLNSRIDLMASVTALCASLYAQKRQQAPKSGAMREHALCGVDTQQNTREMLLVEHRPAVVLRVEDTPQALQIKQPSEVFALAKAQPLHIGADVLAYQYRVAGQRGAQRRQRLGQRHPMLRKELRRKACKRCEVAHHRLLWLRGKAGSACEPQPQSERSGCCGERAEGAAAAAAPVL